MQLLRLPTLVLGTILLLACGTTTPQIQPPKHLRQSARQLNIGNRQFIRGCYAKALVNYQQAHERYSAADYSAGVALSLNAIANVYYRIDELPSAVSVYNDAIETYDLTGDRSGAVRAMCNKAAALMTAGDLSEAQTVLDKADKLANRRLQVALRLKTRAMLNMRQGEAKNAETLLKKAIRAAETSEPDQLSSATYAMGELLLTGEEPSRAIAYFEKSLLLDQSAGAYDDIAHDLAALGRCHDKLKQHELAATHYKRSIKIYGLLGNAGKVKALAARLGDLGSVPGVEIKATLEWVSLWLAGKKEANICR